jgi:PilZ domain
VDDTVTERRRHARFRHDWLRAVRATLRAECRVALIDISAGGALVRASRPLRPGARVHLQCTTDSGAPAAALPAHVLRCAVWALDPHEGVTYQGALRFEHRCEWSESASLVPSAGGASRG